MEKYVQESDSDLHITRKEKEALEEELKELKLGTAEILPTNPFIWTGTSVVVVGEVGNMNREEYSLWKWSLSLAKFQWKFEYRIDLY